MSITHPTISIVVTAYNSAQFIALMLEGAIAQTFRDWEMVVVDDGSPDDVAAIIENFCRREPRIRLVRQSNQGVAHARNRGLAETNPRAEFVIFLDGDDVWQPAALATLLAALEAQPQAAGAHSIARMVDDRGELFQPGEMENILRQRRAVVGRRVVDLPPSAPTTFSSLLVNCWLVTPGICLLRRSFLERTDGFRQAMTPSDDWELWLRLTRLGDFIFVDEVLLDYRRHDLSVSADHRRMIEARSRIFDHLRRDPALTPDERWMVKNVYACTQRYHAAGFRRAAREKFRAGDWRGALRQLGYAADYSFRAVRGPRRGRG